MSLKSRVLTPVAIVVLVGAGMYAWAAKDLPTDTRNDDENTYLVTVTWSPQSLPIMVTTMITVAINGFPQRPHYERASPWGNSFTAKKGSTVEVTAILGYEHTFKLDCIIMVNGRTVPKGGQDKITAPGTVYCVA